MLKATLLDFTGKGRSDESRHAANLLVFTKSTRLTMSPGLLEQIQDLTDEEIKTELDYMAGTIPSSWEFVDVTFLITGLSRAAAQQVTRTRTASYAMQSQRVNDVSEACVVNPFYRRPSGDGNLNWRHQVFEEAASTAMLEYGRLLRLGISQQDARGILPMNVECNLVAKYNLRSFVELIKARRSLRVQGEYSELADQMYEAVIAVWPWAEPFFESSHEKAIGMLTDVVNELGLKTGEGTGWKVAKAIDLLRKS